MPSLFVTSVIAFFSTTIDDFAVLLIFYAKAKEIGGLSPYIHVSLGQILGFTFVVALSLTGLIIGAFVPQEYVNTIGLIPIILGLKKAFEVLHDDGYCTCCGGEKNGYQEIPDVEQQIQPTSPKPQVVFMKDMKRKLSVMINNGEKPHEDLITRIKASFAKYCLDPLTLEVLMYAIVCSSDNIGIYIALFATMTSSQVIAIISIFYLMLAATVVVALLLVQVKWVAETFEKYSKYMVPPLLIFLGLCIVSDSVLWPFK